MNGKIKVLIVEDEQAICNFLYTSLKVNGYYPLIAKSGKEALSMLSSHCPDLVLLDLGLPDIDGNQVLEELRKWFRTPVIIVSARGHEQEKVHALDLGADDYITKPFGIPELLARVRTALRHSIKSSLPSGQNDIFHIKDLTIDFTKRIVTIGENEIHLTQIEFKIVSLLAKSAGRVLTYDHIITEIWGPYAIKDNQILRVNMANIRRKLEQNPAEPQYIHTEVGIGYRMTEE